LTGRDVRAQVQPTEIDIAPTAAAPLRAPKDNVLAAGQGIGEDMS